MIFKSQTPFECALKFITQLKNAATNQSSTEEKEYFYPHFPFNQQCQLQPLQTDLLHHSLPQKSNNMFNT